MAVALIDIDHFKAINDSYGHIQGDVVLNRIASLVREAARGADIAVRFGGEEFAVFLAGTHAVGVESFAERLCCSVQAVAFDPPMKGIAVTISIGVAVRTPGEILNDFLGRADTALYNAKQAGRNRVCMADS